MAPPLAWYEYAINSAILLLILTTTASEGAPNFNELYLQSLLQNMNTSVDPCEDFYQFACGNWAQNHASSEYLDVPGYMDHKVNKQLLDVLQRKHVNATGIYAKVWHHYQACVGLQVPALNAYLRLVQREINVSWPIFREDWDQPWQNATHFDWLATVAHLRVYGLNGVFLTQHINARLSNGSHSIIELHQHLARTRFQHKDIAEIFKNFGMTPEESENVTLAVMTLEEKMANLSMPDLDMYSDDEDANYRKSFREMTVEQLMVLVPLIDWPRYLTIVLDRPVNITVETVQTFALNVDYFDELIVTLNDTANETICYYIMLKFMYQLSGDLPQEKGKSMHCIKHLRGVMPLAMNYLYERYIYKPLRRKTDARLHAIFVKLRLNFAKLLAENHLQLHPAEHAFVLDELITMRIKIGNIPDKLTQQFVEQYYENITINATDFYANHLQLLRLATQRSQQKLHNIAIPLEEQFFEHEPETASSSSPVKVFDNAILVPYGYLQLPLFHDELDTLFQYSLFGFILAHEIVHAYDMFHIVYDRHGNYNEIGVAVAQHYWPHIGCFERDSLSENIADIVGLRLAHRTYFDDLVETDLDAIGLALASSNLTARQMFFVNSVQFLCANMAKVSTLNVQLLDLEHDMHDVRVQQNWGNYEEFAAAFKCSNGTKMNPAKSVVYVRAVIFTLYTSEISSTVDMFLRSIVALSDSNWKFATLMSVERTSPATEPNSSEF